MDSNTRTVISSSISQKNNLKDIKHNLKSLRKKNEINKLLIDDAAHFDLIITTRVMLSLDDYKDEVIKYILEYKAHEKFAHIFDYLCTIRNELNFSEVRPILDLGTIYKETSPEEKRIFSLIYLDWIINFVLLNSIEFRIYLCQNIDTNKSFVSTFINVLSDLEFYNKFVSFYQHGLIINILNCISKSADDYKFVWKEYNLAQVLLKFSQTYSNYKIYAYNIIANTALDTDIEQIDDLNQIIDEFSKLIIECINNSDGRLKQEFDDLSGKVSFEVLSIQGNSITDFLFSLYKISINDKYKKTIYDQSNLREALKNLILTGLEIEKQHAIQLLAQLCFNQEICKNLTEDKELVDYITNLEQKNEYEFKKLKKSCKNFLWILTNSTESDKKLEVKDHIMISYNTVSRETCLKLKSELERLNYKVWIDLEETHGSNLESMTTPIEEAKCVFICCNEKYRESVYCQAEAQYANKFNKVIIPLIMQQGYQNVKGWLGKIIADKTSIDFTKYKFEEAIKRLRKQLKLHFKDTKQVEKSSESVKPVENSTENVKPIEEKSTENVKTIQESNEDNQPIENENIEKLPETNQTETTAENTEEVTNKTEENNNNPEINLATPAETVTDVEIKLESSNADSPMNWSDEQVQNWCTEKELGNFYETLKPLNGQILNQLYQLQVHTPEFFFKALTKYDSIDIKAVASFSCLLKELFEKK